MTDEGLDLDAYCARIGYAGPRSPTYGVLASLVEHHVLAIPFENLDVVLGRTIHLEPSVLQAKLVSARRGGYCFEHNALLALALRQIGFDVTLHLGRGRWRVPPGVTLPRTHMALTVALEGERFLVDGGYGGVGLTSPLKLDSLAPQASLFEEQQVVREDGERLVQARIAGEWRDLYTFADVSVPPIDFEVANWYTATHPESRFRLNLIVSCARREARYVLFNRELTTYGRATKEVRSIASSEELLDVLTSVFGLRLAEGASRESMQTLWATACAGAGAGGGRSAT